MKVAFDHRFALPKFLHVTTCSYCGLHIGNMMNSAVLCVVVQVILNNVEYQPGVGSNNKKMAKLQAAQMCLEQLGLM